VGQLPWFQARGCGECTRVHYETEEAASACEYGYSVSKQLGDVLRRFPGYLKWRSTHLEFETLSKWTVRFVIQWYNMAIRPSISQALATAI
jgi:hypothetical protein